MPLPRLPDIPVESWAADQADLFGKQIKNYFPALEFQTATDDQNNTISPDWPYPGGQDQWEQAAQQAAEDEQRRQQEQLAAQQAAAQEQARQQQEAQVEAEAAQHQSLLSKAWDMASGLGIPTPDQAFGAFQSAVGQPPGTGDNTSTTGAFEQGTPYAPFQDDYTNAGHTPPIEYPGTLIPIRNPDGSVTTERSITVTEPDLNNGQATNIPTVWGGRVVPNEDAVDNAVRYGQPFPSYPSIDEAVQAAEQRSRDLGSGAATSIGGAEVPNAQPPAPAYQPQPVPVPEIPTYQSYTSPEADARGQWVTDTASQLPSALWNLPGQAVDLGRNLGRLALGDNAATELASGAQGVAALPGMAAQAAGDFGDYTAERASELPGQATTVAKGIGQLALGDNAATELGAGISGLNHYIYQPLAAGAEEVYPAVKTEVQRRQDLLYPSEPTPETEPPPTTLLGRLGKAAEQADQTMERAVPLYGGIKSYQNIQQQVAGAAGKRLGEELFPDETVALQNPLTGTDYTNRDLVQMGATMALDPGNYVGGEGPELGAKGLRALEMGAEGLDSAAGRRAAGAMLRGAESPLEDVSPGLQRLLGEADDPLRISNLPSALWELPGQATGLAGRGVSAAGRALGSVPGVEPLATAGRDLLSGATDVGRGLLDRADLAAGQGVSALADTGRKLYQTALENPDKTAALVGGAASEATAPDDLTPEQRLARGLTGAGGLALAIQARKLPMAEAGAAGARRMYHGAGVGYSLIDALKFDLNGLFGPAHYLTSDPRIAATYAMERQPAAMDLYQNLQDSLTMLEDDAREPNISIADREHIQSEIARHHEDMGQLLSEMDATGPNIRPADLDDRAVLFHADQNVPKTDLRRIAQAASRLFGDDPDRGMMAQQYSALSKEGRQITGEELYNALAQDFAPTPEIIPPSGDIFEDMQNLPNINEEGSKEIANQILSEAGFDGVYYKGGRLEIPDEATGRVIQHDAVAIFPDKLDAIQNAFSLERRASQPTLNAKASYPRHPYFQGTRPGEELQELLPWSPLPYQAQGVARTAGTALGAASGGLTGALQGDENTTWQERARNAAAGATVGGLFGHSVGGAFGYDSVLGLAKLTDKLIRDGAFDREVLSTHPGEANRIKAMLGLAAEGVPDDEFVQIPGQVSTFFRGIREPELQKMIPKSTGEFPFDPDVLLGQYESDITAGQIRKWLGETTTPSGWRQALGDLLVDKLTGQPISQLRQGESRADIASVRGELPEHIRGMDERRPNYPEDASLRAPGMMAYPMESFASRGRQAKAQADRFVTMVDTVAADMEIRTPTVLFEQQSAVNAAMIQTRDYAPAMVVTRGALRANMSDNEMEAMIRHELSHGAELMADSNAYPAVLQNLPEGLSIPRRGYWKDKLETGLQIPENATDEERATLTTAFDKATAALLQSQKSKRAYAKIRYDSDAKKAWDEYESLRTGITGEPGAGEAGAAEAASTASGPVEAATPESPAPTAPTLAELDDEYPFGRPTTETPGVTPEGPAATTPAQDLSFAPEPPPAELDPKYVFDPADAGKLVKQLSDQLAGSVGDQSWMNKQAVQLLGLPKVTGRNVMKLLTGVGERRAILRPGRGTAEEQGQSFAQKFLADHGWIDAPAATQEGTSVLRSQPELEAALDEAGPLAQAGPLDPSSDLAPTARPSGSLMDRATGLLSTGAQMGISGGIGAAANQELNPDDPNAALKGFAAGALIPAASRALVRRGLEAAGKEVPDAVGTLGIFGGVNNKVSRGLEGNIRLTTDPSIQQFLNPSVPQGLQAKKFSEQAHDLWREKFVTGMADSLGVLQGLQNDLSRIYKDQTGKLLSIDFLAAATKRLNGDRQVEMDVQDHLTPHLDTIKKLGVKDAFLDNYLLNLQNISIAQDQFKRQQVPPGSGIWLNVPNLTREFPGYQTFAGSIEWNKQFLAQLQRDMTPAQVQEFHQAVQGIHDFGERTLGYLLDGDLITKETYNDLRNRFPHYVPTYIAKYLEDEGFRAQGKSLSVNSTTLKNLTHSGTSSEAISPVAALYAQAYESHAAAQKNIVANRFINMWQAATGLRPLAGFTPPNPARTDLSNVERRIANFGGLITPVPAGQKATNEVNALKMYINGVPMKFDVGQSMGDLVRFPSPGQLPIWSGVMAAFRAGATSRNPAFIAANALLDLSNVAIRESAREGGPQYIPKVLATWGKVMGQYVVHPQAWKDMATGTYRDEMAEALRQGGGMSGGNFIGSGVRPSNFTGLRASFGYDESQLGETVRQLRKNWWNIEKPKDMFDVFKDFGLFKWADTIGERIELAGRIPAFRLEQARSQKLLDSLGQELTNANAIQNAGGTAQQITARLQAAGMREPKVIADAMREQRQRGNLQSALNFRDTTLDFDKGGNFTKLVNQFIPFFNVGVQSVADLQRAYAEHPVAYTSTAALSIVGPMLAAEAWNQGDEQRRRDYADVPDYIKDQGMVVMLPEKRGDLVPEGYQHLFNPDDLQRTIFPAEYDKQGNRQAQFFHFRYRQLAPFAIATRQFLQNTIFRNELNPIERRNAAEILASGFNQLSPVSVENPTDAIMSVVPPVLSTAVQIGFDRDTFHGDRHIASRFGDERATPLSHGVTNAINTVLPWNYQARPSQVEFGLRDFGSGMAGAYMGASQIPGQLSGDEPITLQNMPIGGGVFGRWIKNSSGGIAQDAENNLTTDDAQRILHQYGVDYAPTAAQPAIKNVPLTRSEYGSYQTDLNQITDIVIHEVAQDPQWQALAPADKKYILAQVMSKAHANLADIYFNMIPEDEAAKRMQREVDAGHLTSTGRRP